MAINEKLIHFKNKENFDNEVANGNILDTSIVFIQETKQIYTHGNFYDCNIEDINELNDKIDEILSDIYIETEVDAPNGVYAVTSDGNLVSVDEADESCIGVALIVNDADTPQHIMIEKNGESNTTSIKAAYEADGATNTEYQYFYWGPYDTDVSGITNWTEADGATIPIDYTTWSTNSTYAWNDFNGKSNTAALLNVTDSDSYTIYANVATYCKKFNETETENQGHTDWYIPACGQLALIYINVTDINAALTKIGGTTISTYVYQSSSERSSDDGWYVSFANGRIFYGGKNSKKLVRLIRDLESATITSKQSLKDKLAELEAKVDDVDKKVYVWNVDINEESGTVTQEEYDAIATADIVNIASFITVTTKMILDNCIIMSTNIDTIKYLYIIYKDLDWELSIKTLLITDGDGTQFLSDDGAYKEVTVPTKVSQLENDVPYVVDDVTPENGVYAVAADGSLVSVDEADETCIGVALIVTDADTPQHIMIEKNGEANTTSIQAAYTEDGATDTSYKYFFWGPYNTNVGGIIDWIGGDISSISTDYKTWKNDSTYAWNDYDGKANTAALIHVTDIDIYDTYANAATYCVKFNETETENQGYTDWYIPACGQLSLIYINLTDINVTLTKIGGTTIDSSSIYWSSSEYSIQGGWYVDFPTGKIRQTAKRNGFQIRFIRDIPLKPVKDRISTLESTKQNTLVSGTNIKTINGGSILGSGNMTISKIGTNTVGGTTKPIYLSLGTPTVGSTYAGGTAVTLNGTSKESSTASFYAPTSAGKSGYILTSNGSGTPSWKQKMPISDKESSFTASIGNHYNVYLASDDFTITVPSIGSSAEEINFQINTDSSSRSISFVDSNGSELTQISNEDFTALSANTRYLASVSTDNVILIKAADETIPEITFTMDIDQVYISNNYLYVTGSVYASQAPSSDIKVDISFTYYSAEGSSYVYPSKTLQFPAGSTQCSFSAQGYKYNVSNYSDWNLSSNSSICQNTGFYKGMHIIDNLA